MKGIIRGYLSELEGRHNITILYACEAGSRVWGFPSKDSDYDIRFVYVHNEKDYYLTLNSENKRDVIEDKKITETFLDGGDGDRLPPPDPPMDFDGWDLRKALRLLKKCNPPLYEWFSSPTVYWRHDEFIDGVKDLLPRYYNYPAMCYHYLHMARGNNRDYLQGDEVWLKKYFYVLRPMLAVLYLMEYNKLPPLEFSDLVYHMVPSGIVKREINKLLIRKRDGEELDMAPRIPALSGYINYHLSILDKLRFESAGNQEKSWDPLNELFIAMLKTYSD